uniref:Uncharacterized protein n=1 Tax=Corynecladia elata TaxID=3101723 RepID=A0AA51NFM9_9FLOR|nr:hypothetical protein RU988_pgp213 [Laurencia elata]WMP12581.1 hypothetical protein [Laurencia elata]
MYYIIYINIGFLIIFLIFYLLKTLILIDLLCFA